MGVKKINGGVEDFINKFVRARGGDSTGLDAKGAGAAQQFPAGITATGGIISDFRDVFHYRAHIFRSLDSFVVTGVTGPGLVDFLVVAGGGGGGGGENGGGGGGGAGGYRTSMPEGPGGPSPSVESQVTVSTGTYVVTVGAGGGAGGRGQANGLSGSDSNIAFPTAIPSVGGGAGAYSSPQGASSGGSGGGGQGNSGGSGQSGSAGQGYNGGNGGPYINYIYVGGGGGGAGSLGGAGGYPAPPHPANAQAGAGGAGKLSTITGPAPITAIGFPGPGPVNAGWIAGGGGAGVGNEPPAPSDAGKGGGGGGGPHASPYAGAGEGTQYVSDGSVPGRLDTGEPFTKTAKANSGSGGGGGGFCRAQYAGNAVRHQGGSGGSGIVVVRYLQTQTTTSKATGGAITAFNSKTVHIFQNSGTFTSTGGNITNCEIVCIAGGGGGGAYGGAGGGAGGYRHRTSVTIPSVAHTIVVGGGGYAENGSYVPSGSGGHSSIRDSGNSNPYISFATGGGGAGSYGGSGNPGGSGGGVGWPSSTYNEGNTVASPDGHSPTVQGYDAGNTTGPGGTGSGSPHSASGGGGGSEVGVNGGPTQPYTGVVGGNGGAGQQLPATFHIPSIEPGAYTGSTRGPSPAYSDPTFYANYGPGDLRSGLGAPGPAAHPSPGSVNTNGKYWVCGGGAGGTYRNHGVGGRGGFPGSTASSDIPYAGGGHSFGETSPGVGQPGQHGFGGTGGGGGGSFYGSTNPGTGSQMLGGHGGSGIVLIAYPST